jgi:hypothetical protein
MSYAGRGDKTLVTTTLDIPDPALCVAAAVRPPTSWI